MRVRFILLAASISALWLLSGTEGLAQRWGGFGAVHYSGSDGYHSFRGGTAAPWGGLNSTFRPLNYGSVQHAGYWGYRRPGDYGVIAGSTIEAPVGGGWGVGRSLIVGPAIGTYGQVYGGGGSVVIGPGGSVDPLRATWGGGYTGVGGRNGARAVAALPSAYRATTWANTTYYHYGYNFYRPYWYGGAVSYWPVSPPVGWFFPQLPPTGTITYTANDNIWACNGVYYQQVTQNGQQGYVVVGKPGARAAEEFPDASAASPATPPPGASATPPPAPPASVPTGIPNPLQLLHKMSGYLGKQTQFTITIDETFEEVAESGQKIQLSSVLTLRVRRPDKLAMDTRGTHDHRRVVSDGSGATIIDLTKNIYGTIPVKGTVDSALDALAQSYGMAVPADDLLYKDIYARIAGKIKSGQYLGHETLGVHWCDHLALVQDGMAWQIWIQAGDEPVPRRIVMVHTAAPGHPRYTLQITQWDTKAIPASAFKAELPAGAQEIQVLPIGKAPAAPSAP